MFDLDYRKCKTLSSLERQLKSSIKKMEEEESVTVTVKLN